MPQPLASISIITYNQIDFIRETLTSALDQVYGNLEVVVADDGSTDGTAEVILEYAKKYTGRLVPLVGGPNLGITGNSNRALRACRGKYIAFMGGDDVLLPGKIETQVEWMEQYPEFVISYHDIDVFDSDSGKNLRRWSDRYIERNGKADVVVKYGTFMGATSVMIRRDLCPKVYFDERIKTASDWLFWIETLAVSGGMIGYVDGVFARYRRHANNVTSSLAYKYNDSIQTLNIVENNYPGLSEVCQRRRAVIYLIELKQVLIHSRFGEALSLCTKFLLCGRSALFALKIAFRHIFGMKS